MRAQQAGACGVLTSRQTALPTRLGPEVDAQIHLISAHTILSTGAEEAQEERASITVLTLAGQQRQYRATTNSRPLGLVLCCTPCITLGLLPRHCCLPSLSLHTSRFVRKARSQLSFLPRQLLCYFREIEKWKVHFWYCQKHMSLSAVVALMLIALLFTLYLKVSMSWFLTVITIMVCYPD